MTTSIAIYCLSKQSVVGIFPYTEEFEQRLKKEYDLIPDKEDYEFLYVGFDYSNLEEWCRERMEEISTYKEAAKQRFSHECRFGGRFFGVSDEFIRRLINIIDNEPFIK